jgi:hypothetical protein
VEIKDAGKIQASPQPRLPEREAGKPIIVPLPEKRKRRFPRRLLVFSLFLLAFAGGLFATQNYLRNSRLFPEIQNPFKKSEGVALMDLNLRPQPGTDNQPVGLVPKNSRVRIVNTRDNWYEVDVIQFARPKDNQADAEHGWVSRKFIDVQEQ